MPRFPLVLVSLLLALAAPAAEAGAAALKPLPKLNGVRCRQVVADQRLIGFSCGRPSDLRSYVVTIEVAQHSPYGPASRGRALGQLGAHDAHRVRPGTST